MRQGRELARLPLLALFRGPLFKLARLRHRFLSAQRGEVRPGGQPHRILSTGHCSPFSRYMHDCDGSHLKCSTGSGRVDGGPYSAGSPLSSRSHPPFNAPFCIRSRASPRVTIFALIHRLHPLLSAPFCIRFRCEPTCDTVRSNSSSICMSPAEGRRQKRIPLPLADSRLGGRHTANEAAA